MGKTIDQLKKEEYALLKKMSECSSKKKEDNIWYCAWYEGETLKEWETPNKEEILKKGLRPWQTKRGAKRSADARKYFRYRDILKSMSKEELTSEKAKKLAEFCIVFRHFTISAEEYLKDLSKKLYG